MGISDTIFYIYSWNNYKKSYFDSKPAYSILYIISAITCIYLWGQIIKSFNSNTNGVINVLLKEKGILFSIFNFFIGMLIIAIYAIQFIGLSHNNIGNIVNINISDDISDKTLGYLFAIIYLISTILICLASKMYPQIQNYISYILCFAILATIFYYSSIIHIITGLENRKEKTENTYCSFIGAPITLYLILYLFIYCIILRTVSSIKSSKSQCIIKYNNLVKCLEETNITDPQFKKFFDTFKSQAIKGHIENLHTNSSSSCHKDAISALVINLLIILTGSNIMFAFLKPDMFITGLVIQRLFFGSYYNPSRSSRSSTGTPPHSTNYNTSKSQLVKTWDLLGFPLIKFILWFSDVSPEIYDHDVEFGSTNNELFGLGKKITSLPLGQKASTSSNPLSSIFSQIWGKSHSSTNDPSTPEVKASNRQK